MDSEDFSTLPVEIIEKILNFLEYADLQSAAATCSRWLLSANTAKIKLRCTPRTKSRTFAKSLRCFQNICFEKVSFQHLLEILLHMQVTRINSIQFVRLSLSCSELLIIFEIIGVVKEVMFSNCSVSGHASSELCNYFSAVISFQSSGLHGSTTALILSSLCSLRKFEIFDTHIDNSLFISIVLANKKSINNLALYRHFEDYQFLSNVHNLEKIVFTCAGDNLLNDIESIIASNPKLKYFQIEDVNFSLDLIMDILLNKSTSLEALVLGDYVDLTDKTFETISRFQTLRILNINACMNMSSNGFLEAFGRTKNYVLTELHLTKISIDQQTLCITIENCPNLRALSVGHTGHAVTSITIKVISNCLRKMHHLDLAYCKDVGESSLFELKKLKHLSSLNLSGINITDIFLKEGLRFVELRKLILTDCVQIEYCGFEAFTRFCPSLEILNLMRCRKVTDSAVEIVAKNLKRLRYLNFNGCCKLTVNSIDAIARNCKSLKILHIYDIATVGTDNVIRRLSAIPALEVLY